MTEPVATADAAVGDSPVRRDGPPQASTAPSGGSAVHAVTSVGASPSQRAWLRFKRNRLGFWSLVIFCVLVTLSLCAELVSNDRPLIVRFEGQTYFPLVKDYSALSPDRLRTAARAGTRAEDGPSARARAISPCEIADTDRPKV